MAASIENRGVFYSKWSTAVKGRSSLRDLPPFLEFTDRAQGHCSTDMHDKATPEAFFFYFWTVAGGASRTAKDRLPCHTLSSRRVKGNSVVNDHPAVGGRYNVNEADLRRDRVNAAADLPSTAKGAGEYRRRKGKRFRHVGFGAGTSSHNPRFWGRGA